jgi:hypothetical protein
MKKIQGGIRNRREERELMKVALEEQLLMLDTCIILKSSLKIKGGTLYAIKLEGKTTKKVKKYLEQQREEEEDGGAEVNSKEEEVEEESSQQRQSQKRKKGGKRKLYKPSQSKWGDKSKMEELKQIEEDLGNPLTEEDLARELVLHYDVEE